MYNFGLFLFTNSERETKMTVSSYDITVIIMEEISMPTTTFFNLPEEKKSLIIEAAVEELYEKGYEKMSIANIIAKAQIPRGSFYQYFEDKQDLYKFIIIQVIGNKKHDVFVDESQVEKRTFLDVIRELFISGINFYKNQPKLAIIATEFLSIKDTELRNSILGNSEKLSHNYFKGLIERRKKTGEIPEQVDTEVLIYLIHTINYSFADYFLKHKELGFESQDLIHTLDRMLFIMENGITSKNEGRGS
jgi:AcrR family transcriptional regulator